MHLMFAFLAFIRPFLAMLLSYRQELIQIYNLVNGLASIESHSTINAQFLQVKKRLVGKECL